MSKKTWICHILLALVCLVSDGLGASYVHIDVRDIITRSDQILIGTIRYGSAGGSGEACMYLDDVVEISAQGMVNIPDIQIGVSGCTQAKEISTCPDCIQFWETRWRRGVSPPERVMLFMARLVDAYEPYESQGIFLVQPDGQ